METFSTLVSQQPFFPVDRDLKASSLTSRSVKTFYRQQARKRLIEQGVQVLSDSELLSILLASNASDKDSLITELLIHFGSLRGLLTADYQSVRRRGLSLAQYTSLQASLELTRRHYRELMKQRPALGNPKVTSEYVRMHLRDLPHEVFCVLYLDSRHRVIEFQELFRGTLDGAAVHPREVVKAALAKNAAAVIAVHNHPSGSSDPSQADELITLRMKEALGLLDIRLLDHLIVADGRVESFAERGLL